MDCPEFSIVWQSIFSKFFSLSFSIGFAHFMNKFSVPKNPSNPRVLSWGESQRQHKGVPEQIMN